ncbi:hypothetical protein bcgnr5412_23400 [Bacillus cereus]
MEFVHLNAQKYPHSKKEFPLGSPTQETFDYIWILYLNINVLPASQFKLYSLERILISV